MHQQTAQSGSAELVPAINAGTHLHDPAAFAQLLVETGIRFPGALALKSLRFIGSCYREPGWLTPRAKLRAVQPASAALREQQSE
mgnify:FL=1